jgi:hypothetical protein
LPIIGNKDIGVTETPVEPPKKTIKVCQAASEDDSEGFPVLLIVENIKNLVLNLLELLQLQNSENKPVVLLLNKLRIIKTNVIPNDSSYALSSKVKDNLIKIYLDSDV